MSRPALLAVVMLALCACGDIEVVTDCEPADGVEPICGFRAPEDLVHVPDGPWLIVSEMPHLGADGEDAPGRLAGFDLERRERFLLYPAEGRHQPQAGWGEARCADPPPADFAPHGIDLVRRPDGRWMLVVVSHRGVETLELFELTPARRRPPQLTWRGCITAPPDTSLNDVAALPDGRIWVSNMFTPPGGLGGALLTVQLALGSNTGDVRMWAPGQGWQRVPNSDAGFTNGVVVSPDGAWLVFAAYTQEKLIQLRTDGSERHDVALDFKPDNLSWTADGRVLAGGIDAALTTVLSCARVSEGVCATGFAVAEHDIETRMAHTIVRHDGAAGGAGSVAIQVGPNLYVGAFAGDRILRVRAPSGS